MFILFPRVRPQIPVLKDVQPLLEMDRDERKLDVFLTFHRSSLHVSDMKIFLPFTINLDPYIKKKIKEEQQGLDEEINLTHYKQVTPWNPQSNIYNPPNLSKSTVTNRGVKLNRTPNLPGQHYIPPGPSWTYQPNFDWPATPWVPVPPPPPAEPAPKPLSATTALPVMSFINNEIPLSLIINFEFVILLFLFYLHTVRSS